jgi:hypothetical protein
MCISAIVKPRGPLLLPETSPERLENDTELMVVVDLPLNDTSLLCEVRVPLLIRVEPQCDIGPGGGGEQLFLGVANAGCPSGLLGIRSIQLIF